MKELYDKLKEIRWKRGSNELAVHDLLREIARKMSEEHHAEVMIVVQFPDWGQPHVITSTPNELSSKKNWTPSAVAVMLERLHNWSAIKDVKAWIEKNK